MAVEALVEDLMAYVAMPPNGLRRWRDDACFNYQPGSYPLFANVSAVRSTQETFDDLVDDAVIWFTERGRADFTWFLGPSTTPGNLVERLERRGASVLRQATAMIMNTEPPPVSSVEVREVTTAGELLTFRRIMAADEQTGYLTAAQEAETSDTNAAAWSAIEAMGGTRRIYLALVDGEPVAGGGLQLGDQGFAVLAGGATLPLARGQGCYRALVRHRWHVARGSGIGHLAVQASDYSAPILRRIGFRPQARLTIMQQASGCVA